MPIEIQGTIENAKYTADKRDARFVDPETAPRVAIEHERNGFDRLLIAYTSDRPDGWIISSWVLQATKTLGVLLAHRPGFVAPTVAARQFMTLDCFSRGRAVLHIVTGSSEIDQKRDGDYLNKADRYRRTDEFLTLFKKEMLATEPFDFEGEFYKVTGAKSGFRPFTTPHPQISFAGASEEAIAVAAKHADVYSLWIEPLADTAQHIARLNAAAASHGRSMQFGMTVRVMLADTDSEALARAKNLTDELDTVNRTSGRTISTPDSVMARRQIEIADRGDIQDRALYMGWVRVTKAPRAFAALVGSPETVSDALLDYYKLGISKIMLLPTAQDDDLSEIERFGRDLIPLLRKKVAEYDMSQVSSPATPPTTMERVL